MKQINGYWMTDAGNCRVGVVDELFLSVLGPRMWSDEEWVEFLHMCDKASQVDGEPQRIVSLSYGEGAHPTPTQRRRATDHNKHTMKVLKRLTLITSSTAQRGVLTAFGWLVPGPKMKAYAPEDVAKALQWLGEIGKFDVERAKLLLDAMAGDADMALKKSA